MAPLLTFDDGPTSVWTPQILDLLDEYGQKGVFFVLGSECVGNEHLLTRMLVDGHRIGNHSWIHSRLPTRPWPELYMELAATQYAIRSATNWEPTMWRAPYFDHNEYVDRVALQLGLNEHMGATLVPDDWMATDPEALAAKVLSELKPDSIVSLHDGIPPNASDRCTRSRDVTVEAVRLILQGMKASR